MKNNSLSAIENIFTKGVWYHSFQYNKFISSGTFDYSEKIKDLNIPNLENKSVLDVGCSDGYFSYHFKENMNA